MAGSVVKVSLVAPSIASSASPHHWKVGVSPLLVSQMIFKFVDSPAGTLIETEVVPS